MNANPAIARESRPPYSEEHETGVLGSILQDHLALEIAVREGVTEADFGSQANRLVWRVVASLRDAGSPVNLLTVAAGLRETGNLDAVGAVYLDGLIDRTPTSAHAAYHVGELQAVSRRRQLLEASRAVAAAIESGEDPGAALTAMDKARKSRFTTGLRVLSTAELMSRPDIQREDFIGDGVIFRGGVSAIIGQPGTHKTRLIIIAAATSNIGRSVGNLKTCGRPLRWLILAGNENSEQRYRDDLRRILPHLTNEEQRRVGENVFLHVVNEVGDEIGPESGDAIEATCRELHPDAVVVDPLGDLLSEDNSDVDMRRAVKTVVGACRRGSPETNPAVVFLHHARTGSVNTLQAVGWDRGNYGKGSKALLACCRCVVNVAPINDACEGVIMACGKVNDVHPFATFAVRLDDEGFYSTDPAFNVTTWQNDVAGKHPAVKLSPADVLDVLRARSNAASRSDLQADIIGRFGVTKRTANRRIAELIENRTLKEHRDGIITPAEKALYVANQ
jgi:hypothetical protein